MREFLITTAHEVYEDSYKNGELGNVNNYIVSSQANADTWKEALKSYFEDTLCYDFDEKYLDGDLSCLFYSVLVDNENIEVKEGEDKWVKWTKNKEVLYNNSIAIKIKEIVDIKE